MSPTFICSSGSNKLIHQSEELLAINRNVNSKKHFAENAPAFGIQVPDTLVTNKAELGSKPVADFFNKHQKQNYSETSRSGRRQKRHRCREHHGDPRVRGRVRRQHGDSAAGTPGPGKLHRDDGGPSGINRRHQDCEHPKDSFRRWPMGRQSNWELCLCY